MTSRHLVLCKKIEEVEAEVDRVTQEPLDLSSHELVGDVGDSEIGWRISRVRTKIGFVKMLLAAEMETRASLDEPDHLDQMAERLSTIENRFVGWSAIDRARTGGPASPCSCTSSCLEEDGEEEHEQCRVAVVDETTKEEDDDAGDSSAVVNGAGATENMISETNSNSNGEIIKPELKNIIMSEVNFEDMILNLTEKGNSKKRRAGYWFRRVLGKVGVAALAMGFAIAIAIAIASFGSVAEPGYLVPT